MSGELTQFGANRAVQAGVGQNVAAASAMYLALATALPASPDTATLADFVDNEITTDGYQRQAVTWSSPSGDPSKIANSAQISFGPFADDPPEIGYCFLCDTSIGSTGYVMAYWTFDTPRNPNSGDTLQIGAGDLTMAVD